MRGAEEAKNGRPIIALPSTAKKGTVSRIVAQFEAGTPVTASRHEVHYIVTEYGVAEIFGLTLRERARALIDIAHPDFREQLEREFDDSLRKAGMKNGFTIV
jgi:4-hydroxybutyrate CoA-transferase